eukprot:scaffold32493_cov118-Isochrysis_galbana.AAC.2
MPCPLRSISTTWKLERPEIPLTESTTSPGTSPPASAIEPGSTFLMIGWTDEPSTLKKDLSNASSDRWKTAPILVTSVSLLSRTSRNAGAAPARSIPFPLCGTGGMPSPDELRRLASFFRPFFSPPSGAERKRAMQKRVVDGDDLVTHVQLSGHGAVGVYLDNGVHRVDAKAETARRGLALDHHVNFLDPARRGALGLSKLLGAHTPRRGRLG